MEEKSCREQAVLLKELQGTNGHSNFKIYFKVKCLEKARAKTSPSTWPTTLYPAIGMQLGSSQPGSSDLYWVQAITRDRPILSLKINGKSFEGILDSGADSTVISQSAWTPAWPLQASLTHLQGIGQSKNTLQSSQLLTWEDSEGNTGSTQPFVVPGLPVNLWGRDILSQMKVLMCSLNEVIAQQMLSQSYLPGQGLGKNGQGRPMQVEVGDCC